MIIWTVNEFFNIYTIICFVINLSGMLDELLDEFEGESELPPPIKALVVLKKLLISSVCGNPVEGDKEKLLFDLIFITTK